MPRYAHLEQKEPGRNAEKGPLRWLQSNNTFGPAAAVSCTARRSWRQNLLKFRRLPSETRCVQMFEMLLCSYLK